MVTQEPFEPVETVDGDFAKGLILLCDHARNWLPSAYGDLGLPPAEFERHIAYDIGARDVTVALAAMLGVPAVMTRFSRLLIDPNRGEDDPTVVMRLSDGTVVPGNHPLSDDEVRRRIETYHRPYHRAVDKAIDKAFGFGVVPALLSIHSFTPVWRRTGRPWEIALLWDMDDRFVAPMLASLRRFGDLTVGDNEPYDGALKNDTMYRHGTERGLAHLLVELRQDLIDDAAGAQVWADRMAPLVEAANANPKLHQVIHHSSRTGPVAYRDNPPLAQRGAA